MEFSGLTFTLMTPSLTAVGLDWPVEIMELIRKLSKRMAKTDTLLVI